MSKFNKDAKANSVWLIMTVITWGFYGLAALVAFAINDSIAENGLLSEQGIFDLVIMGIPIGIGWGVSVWRDMIIDKAPDFKD